MPKFNPINLVVDGKQQDFDSLQEFYLKVFQILRHEFPRGHIDYMVFLYDYTLLRGTPLGECCRYIDRSWEESDNFCISVDWALNYKTREKLTDLLRKMSRHITGDYINLYLFDKAWTQFFKSINNEWQPS